ncbi:MAG: diphthine--ammonia ligase [Candidatus Hydrogenedentota bacterium]
MKAFCSWSGGKETVLALYKTMQNLDLEVAYLLNMISEDGKHSRSHGVGVDFMRLQAESIGIPIIQKKTTWKTYEGEFKRAISDLKKEDIEAGVFGDIDLQEHRDWIERVCKDIDIKPLLPLWNGKREELLKEFIQTGFKAIVVSCRADLLSKEWLGRKIDEAFIKDLKVMNNVDLCGENGEYHTFVYDGPIFNKPVEFDIGKKMLKNKQWFLDLIKRIKNKGSDVRIT